MRLWETGHHLNTKTVFPGMWSSVIKMRWPWDRLIFIMEIPIPVRRHPYIMRAPSSTLTKVEHVWFWTHKEHPEGWTLQYLPKYFGKRDSGISQMHGICAYLGCSFSFICFFSHENSRLDPFTHKYQQKPRVLWYASTFTRNMKPIF